MLAILRARFHWFPLHPEGVAFQYTIVGIVFWFSLFLAWAVKVLLLRFGGKSASVAGKPFFYGLAIGYVSGIIVSVCVDLIWFPTGGGKTEAYLGVAAFTMAIRRFQNIVSYLDRFSGRTILR